MIGLKKALKSRICKNTNDKVKGTNLKTNPHRPVSRSRGAVFSTVSTSNLFPQ